MQLNGLILKHLPPEQYIKETQTPPELWFHYGQVIKAGSGEDLTEEIVFEGEHQKERKGLQFVKWTDTYI